MVTWMMVSVVRMRMKPLEWCFYNHDDASDQRRLMLAEDSIPGRTTMFAFASVFEVTRMSLLT